MSDIFYDKMKHSYRKVSELTPSQKRKRRAAGRERSRRYYSRQKDMYGKTHRERGINAPTMGVCSHACGCSMTILPEPVCGMCLQGLCENG